MSKKKIAEGFSTNKANCNSNIIKIHMIFFFFFHCFSPYSTIFNNEMKKKTFYKAENKPKQNFQPTIQNQTENWIYEANTQKQNKNKNNEQQQKI